MSSPEKIHSEKEDSLSSSPEKILVLDGDVLDGQEPTEEQIREYAEFLGLDLDVEPELAWIAREGVAANVPHPWQACTENCEDVFYYNVETGESVWDHPYDDYYLKLAREYKEKYSALKNGSPTQQGGKRADAWGVFAQVSANTPSKARLDDGKCHTEIGQGDGDKAASGVGIGFSRARTEMLLQIDTQIDSEEDERETPKLVESVDFSRLSTTMGCDASLIGPDQEDAECSRWAEVVPASPEEAPDRLQHVQGQLQQLEQLLGKLRDVRGMQTEYLKTLKEIPVKQVEPDADSTRPSSSSRCIVLAAPERAEAPHSKDLLATPQLQRGSPPCVSTKSMVPSSPSRSLAVANDTTLLPKSTAQASEASLIRLSQAFDHRQSGMSAFTDVSPVHSQAAPRRERALGSAKSQSSRKFQAAAEGILSTIRMQFMADDGFRHMDVEGGLVRRIAVSLSSPEAYAILAAKLFGRFCISVVHPGSAPERRIPMERLGDVLAHWNIPDVHVPLFWALLRKQETYWDTHAVMPETIGFHDFQEVLAKVLRRVRDKFCGHKVSKDQFVTQNRRSLEEVYDVGDSCGKGNFGDCLLVTHRKSGKKLVCKKVESNAQIPAEEVHSELDVLKRLDHPHVVRVFEWFESADAYFFVLEYARGGDLRRLLIEKAGQRRAEIADEPEGIGEKLTANLIHQILQGVAYIHSQRITHRDLKPANILLASNDTEKPHLLIADFGLAELFEEKATGVKAGVKGTPQYMALEVFNGYATPRSDMWAVGVIMFELLSGTKPIRVDNMHAMYIRLLRGSIDYEPLQSAGASDTAISFIRKLLMREEAERPSALQALQDSYMSGQAQSWELTRRQARKTRNSLKDYLGASAFAKLAMSCIVAQLDSNDLASLHQTFDMLDTNSDGELSMEEVSKGLQKLGVGQSDASWLAAALDVNHDGSIQYSEFAAGLMDTQVELAEKNLHAAFDIFDADHNGVITLDELQIMLAKGGPLSTVLEDGQTPADVLAEVDTSKDGVISFSEFRAYLLQGVLGADSKSSAQISSGHCNDQETLESVMLHLSEEPGYSQADCSAHAKRLANDHWLRTVGDMRSVPQNDWWRLGLPLKLEIALKSHCGLG